MEQRLNNLKAEFDEYIANIKDTEIYSKYLYAKNMLKESERANEIIEQLKQLQQAKHSCKKNNELELVKAIEKEIDAMNNKYDLLIEVVQFNIAYENLTNLVNEVKVSIENML